jgi:DNA invertase Pin-like site-specific DNA recombinase
MRRRSVKLDAYIRVSRVGDRGGASFISPDTQRDIIAGWAGGKGVVIDQWHEDLDQSGGTLTRPAFDTMMRRVVLGDTGGVVVAKIDRFARSLVGAIDAIQKIDTAGGVFFSVQDGADVPTSAGRLHQRMMLSLAEFELDRITDGWANARERAIHRSVHIGGAPFGYLRNHDGRLIPAPTAELLETVFVMRGKSRTLQEICDFLNTKVHFIGRGSFVPATVAKMLANRTYLGEVRHGEFKKADAHEPLVTPEQFELAQGRKSAFSVEPQYLLVGLVRCSCCRYSMTRTSKVGRPQYRCGGIHAAGRCPTRQYITAPAIESYVTALSRERIAALPTDDDVLEARDAVAHTTQLLTDYRDDLNVQSVLPVSEWSAGLKTRADAVESARKRLASSQAIATGVDFDDWEELPVSGMRAALSSVIDCVFVRPGDSVEDRLHVCWKGEAPDDLPRRGRTAASIEPFAW